MWGTGILGPTTLGSWILPKNDIREYMCKAPPVYITLQCVIFCPSHRLCS